VIAFSSSLCVVDLKVAISFMTVAVTLESQFGIVWPSSFAQALDAMSVLSLDFGVLLGGFCVVDIGFYNRLLSSTLMLLITVLAIVVRSRQRDHVKKGVFVAIYLLLFAYPVLSVKVIEAFACHEIEGVQYLRADYTIECDTPKWRAMAAYAGVWVAAYVIAFPLFVLYKLWCYHSSPVADRKEPNGELVDLRFLLYDYKSFVPALLWEGIEMVRKLLLTVVGSFWSTKSTMCIVTAFLISASFLCLHMSYQPFDSCKLNRMQTLALVVLTLLYFMGVLLKTQTVEEGDREDLGVVMVALLVSVFVSVVTMVLLETHWAIQWSRNSLHAFTIMFEGHIRMDKGGKCVASFPGKYEDGWNKIVKLSSNNIAKVSVACVFLPMHTPRFGTHEVDDECKEGKCYCHAIYGAKKVGSCLLLALFILWFSSFFSWCRSGVADGGWNGKRTWCWRTDGGRSFRCFTLKDRFAFGY
jgi:hypothetical protein